jgi:hypothetical protein
VNNKYNETYRCNIIATESNFVESNFILSVNKYNKNMAGNEKIVPWAESIAKEILITEIMIGTVTDESNYKDVYNSNPEYQKYKKENFRTNLKNLLKAVKKKEGKAIFDQNAVEHDRNLYPRGQLTNRGYPFWDTSEASKLLKEDIDNEQHKKMKAEEFWNSREAYKLFPKDVFRKHIYQECTKRLQSTYWLTKRNKGK